MFSFDLTLGQWVLVAASATMIGMSKTGIQGIGTLVVPLLALVFGAKPSTGVILPMLCMADLFAVVYYRRSGNFKLLVKLLPWTVAGFFVALWVDSYVPATQFRILIGLCILIGLGVLLYQQTLRRATDTIPSGHLFAACFGILGGFTTMIGNAAGPIMAVYLLAMRLPKQEFVGTGAWFFLVVNLLKVPLQIFVWDNISYESFSLNLFMLPCIAVGAWIGIKFVRLIPERWFRYFVITVTAASALLLLI